LIYVGPIEGLERFQTLLDQVTNNLIHSDSHPVPEPLSLSKQLQLDANNMQTDNHDVGLLSRC